MKKVLLFLTIALGLAFLEPRSRVQIMKLIRPVTLTSQERTAERALEQMALDVQKTAETGVYPQPGVFDQWLLQTYGSADDPWGSRYYIEIFADSFVVASPGPDSRRRTADDIRLAKRRGRTTTAQSTGRPGSISSSIESSYRPPPSGVKSRAVQGAAAARDGKEK